MFRGVSALSLDDKGRLVVPTRYRHALRARGDGHVVVTVCDSERCLWLYGLPEWENAERLLTGLSSTHAASQRLKRLIVGHATDCEMDGAGRILLPAPLREFAGLEKRVVLIGQGNKFEIWNEDHWNERRSAWLEEGILTEPLPPELANLSL